MMTSKPEHSRRCSVCGDKDFLLFLEGKPFEYLCKRCDATFFVVLFDNQKRERLDAARLLSREEKISLGLALNVLAGKYDISAARKRQNMKERERSGKTQDFFAELKRRPGSFS